MAAPKVNGRLDLTGVHQKPPASFLIMNVKYGSAFLANRPDDKNLFYSRPEMNFILWLSQQKFRLINHQYIFRKNIGNRLGDC